MKYHNILSKVYGESWCVTRAKYHAIHSTLQARIAGESAVAFNQGDADPNEEDYGVVGGIQVIRVFGILGKHLSDLEMMCGGYDVGNLVAALDNALYDPRIKRVVLHWHSPGGVITGIPECAEKMQEFAEQKILDSFTDGDCCSGALWLASQAPRFYCTQSSNVGSVGVYRIYVDETRALEMDGIKVVPISAGKYKLTGAPFKPLTDDEISLANAQVAGIKQQFDDALSTRQIEPANLEGQLFRGQQAAEIGMVDGLVSDLEELLEMPDP